MTSSNDGDWIFDPSLAGINRRLQHEFRQEAEAVEAETKEFEQRLRTFTELVLEARNRGDRVRIDTRRRQFLGTITYAAKDFVTLKGSDFEADLNVNAVAQFSILEQGHRGGAALPDGPGTFEMRLLERRGPGIVEIGQTLLDDVVTGRIVSIGQDHVMVATQVGDEVVLPLANVAYMVHRRRVR